MPDWSEWLKELARRQEFTENMGGPEKLAAQHAKGKMDARARITTFLDKDSFTEYGALAAGAPPSGLPLAADSLVGGTGTVDGAAVVVMAEDFTVRGGSIGHVGAAKRVRLAGLALQENIPFVMMLDGAGGRSDNALERYPRTPNDLQVLAKLKGKVPIVALVLGPSAGHGALGAVFADFVIISDRAALFVAGPPLVKAALGQQVSAEDLGGPSVHIIKSGTAHNRTADDKAGLELARTYLSYFTHKAIQDAQPKPGADDTLLEIIPSELMQPYDMALVIERVVDPNSALFLQPDFGGSLLIALARLAGQTVMVVASQPLVMGGAITREAADKAAHFLTIAQHFHLPTIFLCDTPGVMPGPQAEQDGTLKSSARFFQAQSNLSGPKIHVTLHKAFGFGSSLMAMNPFDGQTITMAFPNASLGAMPAKAGAKSGGASNADAQKLAELQSGAWKGADNMAYDRVIKPQDLRIELVKALGVARGIER